MSLADVSVKLFGASLAGGAVVRLGHAARVAVRVQAVMMSAHTSRTLPAT